MLQFPLPIISSVLLVILCQVLCYRLLKKKFQSSFGWYVFALGSVLLAALLFFFAPWVFMSMYLRWVFAAVYIVCLVLSFKKNYKKPWRTGNRPHPLFVLKRLIIAAVAGFLVYMYAASYSYNKNDAVELVFPFKHGSYYFMQAGSNRLSNPFHSNYSVQKYGHAMDIAKLNKWGNRANGISTNSLTDYEIYNDTVYSPCSGTVVHVVDGVPDNAPGELNIVNIHGNHIVILYGNHRVFLGHLKPNTITVKVGQKVAVGQPLGRQGNAGFSVEPHLHLNVVKNFVQDSMYSGTSVPVTFKGRFYTINEVITP